MIGAARVADPDGVMTVYRRHYKAAHNDLLKPFDGISELLQRLNRAGVRIGVVSSKKADYLQLGLEALGLDRWVVLLVGADGPSRTSRRRTVAARRPAHRRRSGGLRLRRGRDH